MEKITLNIDEVLYVFELSRDNDTQHQTNNSIDEIALGLVNKVLIDQVDQSLTFEQRIRMVKCIAREKLGYHLYEELSDESEERHIKFAMFESRHPDGLEIELPTKERISECTDCVIGQRFGIIRLAVIPFKIDPDDHNDIQNRLDNNEDPIKILMDIINRSQDVDTAYTNKSTQPKDGSKFDMFPIKPSCN